MYFPKREEQKQELPKYKNYEEIDVELEKLSRKDISDIKKEFKRRYIDEEELKKKLQNIEMAQINRFYSIVENRKFVFDSGYIKEIIEKQINRGIGEKKEEFLEEEFSEKEKSFYKYFQENFIEKKICKNKTENFILMNMIKRYKRYLDGMKKLTRQNSNNE